MTPDGKRQWARADATRRGLVGAVAAWLLQRAAAEGNERMNDPASGSGSKGGTGGHPAVPAPGSPETPQPPGGREAPAPGTPTARDTLRRL